MVSYRNGPYGVERRGIEWVPGSRQIWGLGKGYKEDAGVAALSLGPIGRLSFSRWS
jgi:hypothetical protein